MSRNNNSKLVSFTQSSGVELNINLIVSEKLSRQDQKLQTLTQYVEKYPSGWKKRLELADLLYAMGCLEQAVEQYRSCLEKQPQLIEVRLKLGKILQLMGKTAEAIEIYESALSVGTSPASPLLESVSEATRHHILGLIAVCQGETQGAIIAFESATSLEPNNPSHWLALGEVHMEREDVVAAKYAFDAILSLKPDDLVALLANYDALLEMGNLPEAQNYLVKAEELAPNDFRVLKRLAYHRCQRRLVKENVGKQTKQIITAALKLAPNAPDAHVLLAYYHIFRGEWEKGVTVSQQFTDSHPNNPNGWYYYGRCLFHTGEYEKAMEAMLSAHRLYPDDCEIYRGLCEILHHSRQCRDMKFYTEEFYISFPSLLEEMLEKFPQRWNIWATVGRSLVECFGEIERGCWASEQGTRLQPQLPDAWFCHGRVLGLAHKHSEAVEALEKGWDLSQLHLTASNQTSKSCSEVSCVQSVSAAVWLGETYQAFEEDGISRKCWEKAWDLAEELRYFDPVMADYWQGRVFECLGNLKGAVEAYALALNGQLLFPVRGEVEVRVKRLEGELRESV